MAGAYQKKFTLQITPSEARPETGMRPTRSERYRTLQPSQMTCNVLKRGPWKCAYHMRAKHSLHKQQQALQHFQLTRQRDGQRPVSKFLTLENLVAATRFCAGAFTKIPPSTPSSSCIFAPRISSVTYTEPLTKTRGTDHGPRSKHTQISMRSGLLTPVELCIHHNHVLKTVSLDSFSRTVPP